MTMTHTPGPWTLETVRTASGLCHKVGPFPPRREGSAPRHACLYSDYPSESNPADQELLANAHLISAAPELLAALEACHGALEWVIEQGGGPACEHEAGVCFCKENNALNAARAAIAKAKGEQQ